MFGRSPDRKYQHYLNWFANEVADPSNWATMRNDKDCSNYNKPDETPVPYERGEALLRMADPRMMTKAINKSNNRHAAMRKEESKYVSEGGNRVLANPEYEKNFETLKKTQAEISRSYSTYTELTPRQMSDMQDKHKEALTPQEDWKPMSFFQAVIHWFKGGKVQQISNDTVSWRDYNESKRK